MTMYRLRTAELPATLAPYGIPVWNIENRLGYQTPSNKYVGAPYLSSARTLALLRPSSSSSSSAHLQQATLGRRLSSLRSTEHREVFPETPCTRLFPMRRVVLTRELKSE